MMARNAHATVLRGAFVAVTLTGAAAGCAAQRSLVGTWDVVNVGVDRRDQPHWLYVPDDPRLLGRELVVDTKMLTFNDGSEPCRMPRWTTTLRPLRQLVVESFPRAENSPPPDLRDFGVPDVSTDRVSAFSVHCEPTSDGRDAQPWSDTWLVPSAQNRLLMRIGTSAVLTLERRARNAAPRPSFACSRAASNAEKAVCRSVPLAALDRSVSAAFKRSLARGDPERLRAEQTDWMKRRDACGADDACLGDRMRERIDELMQN